MGHVFGFLSGLVFGIGLILAGMTDPMKVKGFLDLAGALLRFLVQRDPDQPVGGSHRT